MNRKSGIAFLPLLAAIGVVGGWAATRQVLSKPSPQQDFADVIDAGRVSASNDLTYMPGQAATGAKRGGSEENPTIAQLTTRLLARRHYSRLELNDTVSSQLLDHFLDRLDPMRLHFLQSDLQEFALWRTKLDNLLWDKGDTSPANQIFARFLQRVDERTAYTKELLNTETFTFTGDEEYKFDREKLPYPKDAEEAKQLWRKRLRYEYLQLELDNKKPEEIKSTLTKRYDRMARDLRLFDKDDIFQTYLTALANVYDPHSDYMGKAMLDSFNISMKLSLFGIGAMLQSEDGYAKIIELIPGGPAMKSNQLKPGDRIAAVAQGKGEPVDVAEMKLDKVVDLIRGQKGTEVRLTVIPSDAPDPSLRKNVTLIRDEVKLEAQEAKAQIIEMPSDKGPGLRLGIIDLPSFYADLGNEKAGHKSTTTDVARLLKKLKAEKVAGIVLDLRRNGGGALTEAIGLTGLFIKEGPVVQVRDSDGKIRVDDDPDPSVQYDGPLIVLTSRLSASASEILAGALQDYGRALIVGDNSTFGKGTVQALVQLGPLLQQNQNTPPDNLGALKLTIQKFYRVSGSSTQLRGVVPDIILPSINSYTEVGESSLDNPMPWDTIAAANYHKANRVQPYLAELRKRSETRVAADKDFAYLREQITRLKLLMATKSVSLNEQKRKTEKQELAARVEARKKELKSRPAPKEKVYALTLKQVDKPGLPSATTVDTAQADANKRVALDPNAEAPTRLPSSPPGSDDKALEPDIALAEARRILQDLIALSTKDSSLTATGKR